MRRRKDKKGQKRQKGKEAQEAQKITQKAASLGVCRSQNLARSRVQYFVRRWNLGKLELEIDLCDLGI